MRIILIPIHFGFTNSAGGYILAGDLFLFCSVNVNGRGNGEIVASSMRSDCQFFV